jgi:hypothetical protein
MFCAGDVASPKKMAARKMSSLADMLACLRVPAVPALLEGDKEERHIK